MYNLFLDQKKREKTWNARLHQCLSERNLTQTTFVAALNQKYNTTYGQKDVSRWINVGNAQKNGIIGFPKYETMLLIADFFNVDVGYLTGETDQETFTMEKACSFLALNQSALCTFRDITQPDLQDPPPLINEMRKFLSHLLGSFEFKDLLVHMYDLYAIIHSYSCEKFDCFESAMGYCQEVNESISLERFKAWELFFNLLETLFPYSSTEDFLIPDD